MNLFPNARWVFFDVGYTLLDETRAWQPLLVALSDELAKVGRPTSVEVIWQTYRQICAAFEPRQWIGLCRRLATNDAEFERFNQVALKWDHNLQVPHDRAGDVLRVMSTRYKLGIIANQWVGTAERMKQHGWSDYLSVIIGSAEAGVTKPDPKIFQMAMQQAGCTAAEAVMVGDRIDNDIKPAKLLGWGTVHVRQGGSGAQSPRSPDEEPTAGVAGIADVPKLFGWPLD
jgi:HAD superfamily hydrolase (TIGR01549 family)